MNKNGVSPLIAMVLLIGLTFVVGITVFIFSTQIQKSVIKDNTYDLQELGLVKFSANYRDADCIPVEGSYCYKIFIVNSEDFSMNFIVKTSSPLGSHISGPEDISLGAYEQGVFDINYPKQLGNEGIYAEIKPIVQKGN